MTDAPDCFYARLRMAKKQHRCCECPAPIEPGELYEYASGVWDGRGNSFKTCIPCAETRKHFLADLEENRWDALSIFGHLQAEMSEFYG